jgi:uncharacterized protein
LNAQSLPGENVEAFYFGGTEKALFGIYHIPPAGVTRNHAVLLIPSIEQEAIRGHRAYRQLAIRLSRLGFPVMRFDYWGTGDSKGEGAVKGLSQWQNDIVSSIAELKNRSKQDHICLAGLRLGGTLATLAAETIPVDGIALWEPVINGESYVEALIEWHQDKLRYFLTDMPSFTINDQPTELLGLEINKTFLDDLKKLDLMTIKQRPAPQMLLVEHQPQDEAAAFKTLLQQWDIDLQHKTADDPRVWTDDPDKALVPNQILQTLVSWFTEKFK